MKTHRPLGIKTVTLNAPYDRQTVNKMPINSNNLLIDLMRIFCCTFGRTMTSGEVGQWQIPCPLVIKCAGYHP